MVQQYIECLFQKSEGMVSNWQVDELRRLLIFLRSKGDLSSGHDKVAKSSSRFGIAEPKEGIMCKKRACYLGLSVQSDHSLFFNQTTEKCADNSTFP